MTQQWTGLAGDLNTQINKMESIEYHVAAATKTDKYDKNNLTKVSKNFSRTLKMITKETLQAANTVVL